MIKATLIVATTLDGFIAKTSDQVSTAWTSKEDKQFFTQISKEIGALIMGRPTYETVGRPLPARLNIVLTTNPDLLAQSPLTNLPPKRPDQPISDFISAYQLDRAPFYTNLSEGDLLAFLSEHGFDKVAICGGSRVYSAYLAQNLVDEISMTVEGTLWGEGIKVFQPSPSSQKWTIVSTEPIGETTIAIRWRRE